MSKEMNEETVKVQGQVTAIKTMRDYGVRIQIDLQETSEEAVARLIAWTNKEFLDIYLTKSEIE